VVPAVDSAFGEIVSNAVRAHHARRLRRIGWEHALDPPAGGWAAGEPAPRDGCHAEVLVDGAQVLPRIAAEIERATSHVYLAGWHFTPSFALRRDGPPVVLRNLLAEAAERVDVRLIAWAGAPLPVFRPTRRQVRKELERLAEGTDIRYALDPRERPLHCHHEKVVVVDDRVAFVGGMDLTDASGDRYDWNTHPSRVERGWHDVTVRLEGPAVRDVADHVRMRWREVTGETLHPPAETADAGTGPHTVQVVRTVPEHIYGAVQRGDFRILESYVRTLRSATSLVYLENQFLWSPEVAEVLRAKLERPPSDRFRLVLVLPAKPDSGRDDTRGVLGELVEADDGAQRLLACTIFARSPARADPVYIHAKVGIVDDRWLTVGSANLNEHSLFNDTEMNVVTHDPGLARATRLRLWAEHLEAGEGDVGGPPAEVFDERWRPTAKEQLARQDAGRPLTHRLVELRGTSRHSRRLLGPVDGLLVDG
jgi:phosphatidylserine/phosphatidylglycerophosphate/cardiolipin synthase-like enzyme